MITLLMTKHANSPYTVLKHKDIMGNACSKKKVSCEKQYAFRVIDRRPGAVVSIVVWESNNWDGSILDVYLNGRRWLKTL